VVAEDEHVAAPKGGRDRVRLLDGERALERLLPDPLHLVSLLGDGGNVVCAMTGVYARPTSGYVEAPANIDRHRKAAASRSARTTAKRGPCRHGDGGAAGRTQEHAAAGPHRAPPAVDPTAGTTWQFQHVGFTLA
jgi:hypothetical protein